MISVRINEKCFVRIHTDFLFKYQLSHQRTNIYRQAKMANINYMASFKEFLNRYYMGLVEFNEDFIHNYDEHASSLFIGK